MPIRTQLFTVVRHSMVYGIGGILTKVLTVLLIPLYTRYLSVSEVGILALLEMAEVFLITVAPFGILIAVWRYLPGSNQTERKRIIASVFWTIQGISLFIFIILFWKSGTIALLFNLPAEKKVLFQLMSGNIFFFSATQFIFAIYQFEQKPFHYLFISITEVVGILGLTIYFVIGLEKGLYGVLLAKLLVLAGVYIYIFSYILRKVFVFPSFRLSKQFIKYGLPLVFPALIVPVLTFSDRFFLNLFVTLEEIGVYSIAYKFGMIINIILIVPLQRAWSPIVFKEGIKPSSVNLFKDMLHYYTLIGAFIFLAISVVASPMVKIITTENYLAGIKYIPWISFAYLISGYRMFLNIGTVLKDKTIYLGYIGLTVILIHFILNFVLIRNIGVSGAVVSTLISQTIFISLVYRAGNKAYKINWEIFKAIKVLIISLLIFLLSSFAQLYYPDISVAISITGIVVFFFVSYTVGLIGSKEILGIKELFQSIYRFMK